MDIWNMKEEWRYVTMDDGEQSVMTHMVHSQILPAGNWLEIMHVSISLCHQCQIICSMMRYVVLCQLKSSG